MSEEKAFSGRVWLGWDPDELQAYNIAELTLRSRASLRFPVDRLALLNLQARGWYRRPTEVRDGRLFDVVSDAPMSTQHAIARFFVPLLCDYQGWALFTDGDVMFRGDVAELFSYARSHYAVQVVQHVDGGGAGTLKKDGDPQLLYARKNWSSVMLINCAHPAWRRLTIDELNTLPGRDLHRFCWLKDNEIGKLPLAWNYLVNVSTLDDPLANVRLAHFTLGVPTARYATQSPFDEEWWMASRAAGYRELAV